MKKYIYFLIAAFVMLGLLCFVLVYNNNVGRDFDIDSSQAEYEEDQILIVNRYVNYAEGYEDEGIFIDAKGRVYSYYFSQFIYPSELGSEGDFLEALKVVQKHSEPVLTLDEKLVAEMIRLCLDVNPAETYEKKGRAFDYGSRILYVGNEAAGNADKMISCREWGDFEGALDSASAKKFMKYFDDTLLPVITVYCEQMTEEEYTKTKAYYYAENALYFQNIHSGYFEEEGRYVVTNEEELAALESLLGSDFGIREWDSNHAVDCVYFVEHVNVSCGGYDLKRAGILCQGGAFEFVPSEASKVPEPGEMCTEALDGFVFVGAVPAEVAGLFVNREDGCYVDSLGNEWKRPK